MKLTSVELHPANSSDICTLSFKDPGRSNPYNVKEIVGLDADEVVNQRYMGFNAIQLSELYLQKRQVVLFVNLNPRFDQGQTHSDLRDALYRMIWSSRRELVNILFKNEGFAVAAVSGVISKFETSQFSENQDVKITVICEEPLLKALDLVSVTMSNSPSLALSVNDTKSTAPHGFKFELEMLKDVSSLLIGSPGLDTNYGLLVTPTLLEGFKAGDVIFGSSEYDDKYLYVVRGGIAIPLIDAVEFNSSWPIMFPGQNTLFAKNIADDKKIVAKWRSLTYFPTYWGV